MRCIGHRLCEAPTGAANESCHHLCDPRATSLSFAAFRQNTVIDKSVLIACGSHWCQHGERFSSSAGHTRIPSHLATSLAGGLVIRTSTNNGGKPWSKSGCRTAHTRNEESTTRKSVKAKGRATLPVLHLSTRSHTAGARQTGIRRGTATTRTQHGNACVGSSPGSCSFTAGQRFLPPVGGVRWTSRSPLRPRT